MQSVARELNLSETAFTWPEGSGWRLRWFTPTVEVDLCGHATLATAFVLWNQEKASLVEPLVFHTRSGELVCRARSSAIEMNFPLRSLSSGQPPKELIEAVGVPVVDFAIADTDWIAELESEATVRDLQPDHSALARLPCRGVIVTAVGQAPYHFVSRFFAPGVGIVEDPVTGSAHCALAPYWGPRLGRTEFFAYQASPRGGIVSVQIVDDRALLIGTAVLMGTLDWQVPPPPP